MRQTTHPKIEKDVYGKVANERIALEECIIVAY